jgi:hypothetical protein
MQPFADDFFQDRLVAKACLRCNPLGRFHVSNRYAK